MRETGEIIDIAQAIERWDELMERCEAGESFVISIDGVPKVRMEPIADMGRSDKLEALQASIDDVKAGRVTAAADMLDEMGAILDEKQSQ